MDGLDTNVIVRFLANDDRAQADQARAVIGRGPVFVPRTVLLEVEWVLRGVYDLAPEQVIPALRAFGGLPGVLIEDAGLVEGVGLGGRRPGFRRCAPYGGCSRL